MAGLPGHWATEPQGHGGHREPRSRRAMGPRGATEPPSHGAAVMFLF